MSESRIPRVDFNEIKYHENVKRQEESEDQPVCPVGASENPEADEWENNRGSHEPHEHWELRKEFLKRNAGRFEKNRLLCLSQAFANMEFLGCKYPVETMELVAELSAGIVEDYRAAKRGRLQRTFVKASDAAERKTKGQNGSRDKQKVNSSTNNSSVHAEKKEDKLNHSTAVSSKNVALQSIMGLHQRELTRLSSSMETGGAESFELTHPENEQAKFPLPDEVNVALKNSFAAIKIFSNSAVEILKSLDKSVATVVDVDGAVKTLDDLYIVESANEEGTITVLTQSFSMCHKADHLRFEFPPHKLVNGFNIRCNVSIGPPKKNQLIISGVGATEKNGKKSASEKALKVLRQLRPVIKIKSVRNRIVQREEIFPSKNADYPAKKVIKSENSVGMKMMLAMGWKGGGLGKQEDGILEPVIESSSHNTRLGLGSARYSAMEFEAKVTELLRMEQDTLFSLSCDIEFSSDFTKGERQWIHNIAPKLGFTSRSYGQGNNRHLIVSRKVCPDQIFREVMHAGGETRKYKVILPDCWQN